MKSAALGHASVLLLALFSCGGGKGAGTETPAPAPPIAVTDSNALAIASSVWLGQTVAAADEILPDQVQEVLEVYLPLLALRPNALPVEIACRTSGTVTVDGSLADAALPGQSAGDHVTALYQRCLQPHESLVADMADGTLAIEVTTSSPEARTFSVRFDSLKVGIAESQMFTQVGEATITRSNDGSAASLSTARLTATGGGRILILTDYTKSFAPDATGSVLSFHGTQSGGDVDGSLSFDTPTPFHRPAGGFPDAGELVITGAAGSRVTVQAQSDGVHAVLVVNGGAPIETTWVALEE